MSDTAGIMYWGDGGLDRIETAYLNGTGRRTLLAEEGSVSYWAFTLYSGDIYFGDERSPEYACLFSYVI